MPAPRSERPRAASTGQRFRKHEHLLLKRDFDHVFEGGCRAADELLTVFVAANTERYSRLGLSVGTRVGGAVQRNFVKRRLREAFRNQKHELPTGFDVVCVARPAAARRESDVAASLRRLWLRAVANWHKRQASDAPPEL